jgi:hypothetical protein
MIRPLVLDKKFISRVNMHEKLVDTPLKNPLLKKVFSSKVSSKVFDFAYTKNKYFDESSF